MLVAGTLEAALRELECQSPDLAVVDLKLPDGSGLDLIRRVRAADGVCSRLDPSMPLMILSGSGGELDRVRGFEKGVDDYVIKPFAYGELRLRIAAVLRRSRLREGRGRLRVGELEIDPTARETTIRGRRVELAGKEFALLRTLAASPTRVFTKDELLRDVWGYRAVGSTRTLDSHACRLRQKLRAQGDKYVVNVWGVGYRLVDGPAESEAA
jgi:DNA-binding response OmpR family regulator